MPPVVKLIQIFILMFSIYGSAFFFLDPKRKHPAIGSALLILGIISYGAGIMLVAQIYHISSHPTNGVLAWGAGALIISAAARDKYGYYLSALLFFIWNLWEVTLFHSAGYLYIIPVLSLLFFSLRSMTAAGSQVQLCLRDGIYSRFHYTGYSIKFTTDGKGIFIMLFVLSGSLLITASKFLKAAESWGAGEFSVSADGGYGSCRLFCQHTLSLIQVIRCLSGEQRFWQLQFYLKSTKATMYPLPSSSLVPDRNRVTRCVPLAVHIPCDCDRISFTGVIDIRGIVVTSLAVIWYFLLFAWHFASQASADTGIPDPFFIIMLPAGAAMISGGIKFYAL